ncbi:MAG: copper homeostasis protein CutC [Candidatus Bipolaricaulota bacterium]
MSYTVEVNSYTLEDVKRSESCKADRVELCADANVGGVTPSFGIIEHCVKQLSIDVAVLIRPREGGFTYSKRELEIIKQDVRTIGEIGADCAVIGMLNENATVDQKNTAELVDLAKSYQMEITFHRAFDLVPDPYRALESLADLGVDRVLTSGQARTAELGLELLTDLVEKYKQQIGIMPAVAVTADNVVKFLEAGIREVHVRPTTKIQDCMKWTREDVHMGPSDRDESRITSVDKDELRKLVEKVRGFESSS